MNELTKFLIEELLDAKKTVAIYGGGFKPPTKGHFNVAKQTLEELPDIDELKIFVGGGVRDGITQDESLKIWEIYKPYLSDKVSIEPSVAPVKSVLGYAKENPDTKVYWVLGAREGEDSDLEDIASRTKSISKYPNLEVKVITSTGGVSGTKTRQAVKDNNKEQFFQFIPDIKEKEQIWNIVSPVVKEEKITEVGEATLKPYKWEEVDNIGYVTYIKFITDSETEYNVDLRVLTETDSNLNDYKALSVFFTAKLKGDKDRSPEIVVNKGELYKVMSTITNIIKHYVKKFKAKEIIYSPAKKENEGFGSQRDNLYKAFISKAIPNVEFKKQGSLIIATIPDTQINEVGEATLKPYKWEEAERDGYVTVVDFTTDNETEYEVDLTTTTYTDDDLNNYKALEVEFLARPKGAGGSSAKIVVNKGELYKVMATITDIIKYYVKKYKAKAIMYSPSKKSSEEDFGLQRDNLYKAFITKAIPGVRFEKNVNFVIAILPDNTVKEIVTDTKVICDNCGWEWPIEDGGKDLYICHKCRHDNNPDLEEASDPQAGTALPYGSGFAPIKENDPFSLNELAKTFVKETFEKAWNLQDGMLSLSKYMIDNGMNIKPLPKIKVIKDDKENASDLLGKTAYYNPMDKSITLYTMNRHPKDVLRSFSHEMIHHEQNLEGRLNNIKTTNTNEDGDLPEIEREAYEKGNMMLRNWEDSIKNV